MTTSKIICALDYSSIYDAKEIVELIKNDVGMLKIGTELFTCSAHDAINMCHNANLPIFLDLKLHDIPETVAKTIKNVSKLGVKFITVHAMGGESMLEHAIKSAQDAGDGLNIACVTILTSLDERDLDKLCLPSFPTYLVRRYATMAFELGIRNFVCSSLELKQLRLEFGNEITLITPGIRPLSSDNNHQKRVSTPAIAIANGANWLVIGRPICNAENPVEIAKQINFEIENTKPAAEEIRFIY
jgi:orotidine-5'-phosphate decarboxylase